MVNGKEEKLLQDCCYSDNLLLKPFAFGWTREVVNRAITKNRNLSCDIYYFSPSGKKIRSLVEVKSHLTDGLTSDCFSFKRQPLGFNKDFETIRNARTKQKETKISSCVTKSLRMQNKGDSKEVLEAEKSNIIINNKKIKLIKNTTKDCESDENIKTYKNKAKAIEKQGVGFINETPKTLMIKNEIEVREKMKSVNKRKNHIKSYKNQSVKKNVKQNLENKKILKRRIQKNLGNEKIFKKIIEKKSKSCTKLLQNKMEKGTINGKKKNVINKSYLCLPQFPHNTDNVENTIHKEVSDSNEIIKNSVAWDLKSIVQKNIGKYREMREKQKLKSANVQVDKNKNRLGTKNKNRTRSEPIAKNKHLYIKPLEKGWKRELVFRTNCAKPGQQADVYYFHPNGKKLRSCREVAENLTRGLTIEYFTFRKEPIGCGEPLEVIRNARPLIKS